MDRKNDTYGLKRTIPIVCISCYHNIKHKQYTDLAFYLSPIGEKAVFSATTMLTSTTATPTTQTTTSTTAITTTKTEKRGIEKLHIYTLMLFRYSSHSLSLYFSCMCVCVPQPTDRHLFVTVLFHNCHFVAGILMDTRIKKKIKMCVK